MAKLHVTQTKSYIGHPRTIRATLKEQKRRGALHTWDDRVLQFVDVDLDYDKMRLGFLRQVKEGHWDVRPASDGSFVAYAFGGEGFGLQTDGV